MKETFLKDLKDVTTTKTTIFKYISGDYYNKNVLQKEYFPYQFDSWAQNKNFGLIDSKGRAVFPKQDAVRLYTNSLGQSQSNLLFVVDAFFEMRKYHLSLLNGDKIDKNNFSIYIRPEAVETSSILDDLYINYTNQVYQLFKKFLLDNRSNSIGGKEKNLDINSFLRNLSIFFKFALKFGVINRSSFITSNFCNNNVSGISISLAKKELYTDYEDKSSAFINDPNFPIFLESAKRFGFFIDKNVPWRLVADLGSQVMLTYAKRYGANSTDEIHQSFYHIAYETDLEVLRNLVVGLWNLYVSEEKLAIQSKEANTCTGTFVEISLRQQITTDVFDRYFSKDYLLRMYFFIKAYEYNLQLTQNIFNSIVQESIKINKYYGQLASLNYLNSKINQYMPTKIAEKNNLTGADALDRIDSQAQSETFLINISF